MICRVVAALIFALSPGCAAARTQYDPAAAAAFPQQAVHVRLIAAGDHLIANVFTIGEPLAFDTAKLHVIARPQGAAASAPGETIAIDVGPAVPEHWFGSGNVEPSRVSRAYDLPVVLRSRPAKPGMYRVSVEPASGFAFAPNGAGIPTEPAAQDVWWPDDTGDDAGLRDLRARLTGHDVYGYGPLQVGCAPAWSNGYPPDQPVHVRVVERLRGDVQWLGTGSMNTWGSSGFDFLAVDPIALVVDLPPKEHASSWGGSTARSFGPCPRLTVADPWHVALQLTDVPPPPELAGRHTVAVGMSRELVKRMEGYPSEYAYAADLDRENVWRYHLPGPFSWSVEFQNDRVSAYFPPGRLP